MTELEKVLGDIVLMLAKETGGCFIPYERLKHEPNDRVEIVHSEEGIVLKFKNVSTFEGVQDA